MSALLPPEPLLKIHTQERFSWCRKLERLVRVEEDCDRAFIHQFHQHPRLEHSRGDGNSQSVQRFAELFVKLPRLFGQRGCDKAGPELTARVALKCNLLDDQRIALYCQP